MYCRKCRYTSFDHLGKCPKCGLEWNEERKKLGIEWLSAAGKGWLEMSNQTDEDSESHNRGSEPDEIDFYPEQVEDETEGSLLHSENPFPDAGDKTVSTPVSHSGFDIDPGFEQIDAEPDEVSPGFEEVVPELEEIDAGLEETVSGMEPDLDFEEYLEKPASQKEPPSPEQDFEIDYPDLEFINSDNEKK